MIVAIVRRCLLMLSVVVVFICLLGAAASIWIHFGPSPIIIACIVRALLWRFRLPWSGVLGSARIANYIDLVFSGLLDEREGVLLGRTQKMQAPPLKTQIMALFFLPVSRSPEAVAIHESAVHKHHWLRLPASQGVHMAYIAPTGGGKSAGNVISNLLTDPSSAVVMDYKGELIRETAYARMKQFGHKVICVAPFGLPRGYDFPISRFNPFQLIDPESRFFHDDAGSIANSLVVHSPNNNQPFFDQAAEAVIHALASGLIIEASAEECTLGELRNIISQPHKLERMEDIMMSSASDHRRLLNQLGGQILGLQGKTRSDVIATANTHLRWLDSTAITKSLAATDFNPGQLLDRNDGMTIYFHIPVNRLHTYRGYTRVIVSSLVNYLFQAGESRDRRIRFYLDESYGLGRKLDALYAAMVFGRSFGINLNFYFQAISQIEELFEGPKAKDFLTNVHPVFTNIRDIETAKSVSAWIGRQTVHVQSWQRGFNMGRSRSFQERSGRSVSESYGLSENYSHQQQAREVLQPEEILQLPKDTTIITLPHLPPILAEPVYYFKDRRLRKLAKASRNFLLTADSKP